jgi:adenylate cyclase
MTISFYLGLVLLVALVGRESGIQINFIAASVALFPILGLGRLRLIATLIAVAIVLHVACWLIFRNGYVEADPFFLLQLYATVVATISVIIAVIVYYAFWIAEYAEAETAALLHRILPAPIAERLKAEPDAAISDSFGEASVLFSDIVGFVPITRELGPARTVAMLNDLVHGFDRLAAAHGVEKIKTIGDAWMAAAGIPTPVPDHAARLARVALGMQALADDAGSRHGVRLRLRIGIALGPVMAGVIGASRFGYDIWGDAVNLAARLESSGEPERIHVSDAFREALAADFTFTPRGATAIKGVGLEDTWFLVGERFR